MFPRYQADVFGGFIDHAHNDYLQFFMEMGLAAPVIVALALAAYVMRMSAAAATGEQAQLHRAADRRRRALLPMMLHSMFDFAIHMPANAMWFATLAGVMFHAGVEELPVQRDARNMHDRCNRSPRCPQARDGRAE